MRVARTAASLAAAPLLLLLGTALRPAGACTSIIIGREASADGSIFIARSDDGEDAHTDTNHLVYHPPREAPALFRSNINRLALELPGPGLAYFGWPNIRADPAQGRNASGESNGVNSAGVALSATESIYNKPEALKADPYKKEDGIIEDAIPSLLLPQMRSAREGAALLGQLVSERGAGEGFGVLFADGREAWYLETASGHHWLAQRIPRHAVFVSANQGRFQEVDLADQSSAIASPGLVEFATKAGLYDPDAGRPFNFTAAFMVDAPHDTTYDYPRIHEMQGLFGGPNARIVGMPVFLRPARKVQPRDVFQAMRLHFEGTPHDAYMLQNPREPFRPIVLLRTGLAHVTQVRPTGSGLPDGLSVSCWGAAAGAARRAACVLALPCVALPCGHMWPCGHTWTQRSASLARRSSTMWRSGPLRSPPSSHTTRACRQAPSPAS